MISDSRFKKLAKLLNHNVNLDDVIQGSLFIICKNSTTYNVINKLQENEHN
jgi:hypothetical protein